MKRDLARILSELGGVELHYHARRGSRTTVEAKGATTLKPSGTDRTGFSSSAAALHSQLERLRQRMALLRATEVDLSARDGRGRLVHQRGRTATHPDRGCRRSDFPSDEKQEGIAVRVIVCQEM